MSKTFRKDLTGQRFGRLVVLSFVADERPNARWLCKCNCGNKKIIDASKLIGNHTKSCGCLASERIGYLNLGYPSKKRENPDIYINKKYGRLLVINIFVKKKQSFAKCLCDCGKEIEVRIKSLKSGQTKSCGCFHKEKMSTVHIKNTYRRKEYGESSFNSLFNQYKKSAKKRGIAFYLSKEDAKNIFTRNCFYCGEEPKERHHTTHYGCFKSNGIDRIDSNKDYTIENTTPCCSTCNFMKHIMGQQEFLDHIKRIYEHQHLERKENYE